MSYLEERTAQMLGGLKGIEDEIVGVNRDLDALRQVSFEEEHILGCGPALMEPLMALNTRVGAFTTAGLRDEANELAICADLKEELIQKDLEAARADGDARRATTLSAVLGRATALVSNTTNLSQGLESYASKERRLQQGVALVIDDCKQREELDELNY